MAKKVSNSILAKQRVIHFSSIVKSAAVTLMSLNKLLMVLGAYQASCS